MMLLDPLEIFGSSDTNWFCQDGSPTGIDSEIARSWYAVTSYEKWLFNSFEIVTHGIRDVSYAP